jgi:vacuolar-type H+-ATPase subunit H
LKKVKSYREGVVFLKEVSEEVLELARKIRSEDNLYIWETAIKEAERILKNRKKMKAVNSYYSNYY